MQSLGKITQCAPAVGAKIWCLLFVCLFVCLFVGHAPSPEHRSFEGCIVRTGIPLPFVYRPISTRFGSFFSEVIALSDTLHSSDVRR